MRKSALAVSVMLFVWPAMQAASQNSGTAQLMLRVGPEARLDPQEVALRFRVSQDGASDVTTASSVISAWVRNLPGQAIRVTAELASFHGPAGPVAGTTVRWTGSIASATGGGRQATCSSGTFAAGTVQDLVTNWQRPGIVNCSVNFELAEPGTLSPGLYAGVVKLAVAEQ
jgi:hypothetical protein